MKLLKSYLGLPKEIYILFVGRIINCIGSFVHPLLTLILTQKIGLSVLEAGSFVTISALCQAPCVILGGKLADTIGAKKVLVSFQSVSAIVFILCGIIKPSHTLIYLLIISSCFSAAASPCYDSIVGNLTNTDNRQSSFSLLYMGLNLGYAIGPAIGGFLFSNHLSLIFIGDALTTLISVLLIAAFIDGNKIKKHTDNTSALEQESNDSVLKVFKERPILLYFSLIMLTFSFAYSQFNFAVPLQLKDTFGGEIGPKYFGMMTSFNGILVILLTPLLTAATKKFRILSVIACGGFLYGMSFGLCGYINSIIIFFAFTAFITIGEILIAINQSTFIANLTPASHRGRVNSVLPIISQTGYALSPTVMGAMINNLGMKSSWLIVGSIALFGSVLMFSLNKTYAKFKNSQLEMEK